DWRYPSAQWVAECERLVQLDGRLPGVLKGDDRPKDVPEQIEFAAVCALKRLPAAASRLYHEALSARPGMTGHLYPAACAAVQAGCGQGEDARGLDATERARWRQQAQNWLRDDLALWNNKLENPEPKIRTQAAGALQLRLRAPSLAGV